jgi:hypothetical protein
MIFRLLLPLILLALLVGACSDNSALIATTTMPPETTAETTTTVPLPQLAGPVPQIPAASLTEDYGGPLPIETACITLEIDDDIGDQAMVAADLTAAFSFIGIEVVDADCDLSLTVDMSGRRWSTDYENVGECFTGWEASGDIVASAGGDEWDWSWGVAFPAPEAVDACVGDETPPGGPVPAVAWVPDVLDVLGDLFGSPGRVSARLNMPYLPASGNEMRRLQPDAVTYDVLTAALYRDDPEDICRAADLIAQLAEDLRSGDYEPSGDDEEPSGDDEAPPDEDAGPLPAGPELFALIPHLIDRLATSEVEGWDCGYSYLQYDIEAALRIITDEDPGGGARGWAESWLQTPEGQASQDAGEDEPAGG